MKVFKRGQFFKNILSVLPLWKHIIVVLKYLAKLEMLSIHSKTHFLKYELILRSIFLRHNYILKQLLGQIKVRYLIF